MGISYHWSTSVFRINTYYYSYMARFLKRLLFIFIISLICFVFWGYHNGITKDNYKKYIQNTITIIVEKFDYILFKENIKPETVKKNKPKNIKPTSTSFKSNGNKKEKEEELIIDLYPILENPFQKIDDHARNCPIISTKNIKKLAKYLQEPTSNDLEKARSIYVWLTDNIKYDDESYNSNNLSNMTAEKVLKERKAVCDGFSKLYYALGKEMDLNIEKVIGFAKGFSYKQGSIFKETNHAWNIIKIDKQWKVFDATWGQGGGKIVKGKMVSTKKFNDNWFNVDPYEAIYSHLPIEENLRFVKPTTTLRYFEKMPNIKPHYFKMGYEAKEIYQKSFPYPKYSFPTIYDINSPVKIISAAIKNNLTINNTYNFELSIPRGINVAIIDTKNKWTYFAKNKSIFKLKYKPQTTGEIKLSIQFESKNQPFTTLLKYNVRE